MSFFTKYENPFYEHRKDDIFVIVAKGTVKANFIKAKAQLGVFLKPNLFQIFLYGPDGKADSPEFEHRIHLSIKGGFDEYSGYTYYGPFGIIYNTLNYEDYQKILKILLNSSNISIRFERLDYRGFAVKHSFNFQASGYKSSLAKFLNVWGRYYELLW